MKKLISLMCIISMLAFPVRVYATETAVIYPVTYAQEGYWHTVAALQGDLKVKSAVLMEASTGALLHTENESVQLPIASVTKVMCMLLIMEAIDSGKITLEDTVTVSERASSMGGSQVYLEPGEKMSVHEMLKALAVVSANDASVALAEHIYGSEESFIAAMNERAAQLGMMNTHFVNTTGLDDEGHLSTAYDVALMTRELLKHNKILEYTTIWMDTIRSGAFGLANTNKLIRFYDGANGMKTGFTDKAMYCLSGTAKRGDMQLIAVVLGAQTSNDRFAAVKTMLDYGFANYAVYMPPKLNIESAAVQGGKKNSVNLEYTPPVLLVDKGKETKIEQKISIFENIAAPVEKGDILGEIKYLMGDTIVDIAHIYASESNERISFYDCLTKIWRSILSTC